MTDHRSSELLSPPRLTPDTVGTIEFPRVMRGYDVQAVEEFRDMVGAELASLTDEVHQLARECEHLAQSGGDPGGQAARIIAAAQRTREECLADARLQAEAMWRDGQDQRAKLITDGEHRGEAIARSMIADAGREAARILAQAPEEAHAKLVRTRALADAMEAHLTGLLAAIDGSLQAFRQAAHGQGGANHR